MHISPRSVFSGRRRGAATVGLWLCLALGWGCSKQQEGERCDPNNLDLDCETGLICVGEAQLRISERGAGLCCPREAAPTVDACRSSNELPDEPEPETPAPETPAPETPAPDAGQTPAADAGGTPTPSDAGP